MRPCGKTVQIPHFTPTMGFWSPTPAKALRPTSCGSSYPMAASPDTGTRPIHCPAPSSRHFNVPAVRRPPTATGSAMLWGAWTRTMYQLPASFRTTRVQAYGPTSRPVASLTRARRCSASCSMYPDLARLDCSSLWADRRRTGSHGSPHKTSCRSNLSTFLILSRTHGPVRGPVARNRQHGRASALWVCKGTMGPTKYAGIHSPGVHLLICPSTDIHLRRPASK